MDSRRVDTVQNGGLKSGTKGHNKSNGKGLTNGRAHHENAEDVYEMEPTRKRLCNNDGLNNPEKLEK